MLAVLLAALESDEDRALFTEVYEQYHIRMEKAAMYILNNQSDAEDAVQNALFFLRFLVRNAYSGASLL